MSKPPAFRQIAAPLDVDDDALDRVADQMGVPTLVKPPAAAPQEAHQVRQDGLHPLPRTRRPPGPTGQNASSTKKTASASIPRRTALEKFTFEVPGYLIDAVKRKALDEHTTARHMVMMALRKDGFEIDDADMIPDGRRSRKSEAS